MKRSVKESLGKIFISLFLIVYSFVPPIASINQLIGLSENGSLVAAGAITTFPDDCNFQCSANDVTVKEMELVKSNGDPLSCTAGTPTSAFIKVTYDNHSTDRYSVFLMGDIYEDGSYKQSISAQTSCIDHMSTGEDFKIIQTGLSWDCGKSLAIKNLVLSWDTNTNTCGNFLSNEKCNPPGQSYCNKGLDYIVTTPLVADFSSTDVCLGESTTFSSQATGGTLPYTYGWDFGDAIGTSMTQNPLYTYLTAGVKDVTLDVEDSTLPLSQTSTLLKKVSVWQNPSSNFSMSSSSGYAPFTVDFTDTSTGDSSIVTWNWDFGDGTTSSDQNPSHTFVNSGSYNVVLTIRDKNTCSDISSQATITVQEALAKLTLKKSVVLDNGGDATQDDFQAYINNNPTSWDIPQTLDAGNYIVHEDSLLSGYAPSVWGGDCDPDGTILLLAGDDKTCTITNDDEPGTLIVKKIVRNNNGGTLSAEDFSFKINGDDDIYFEADEQNDVFVDAGEYSIVENDIEGYQVTYDNCDNLLIGNGETETCTITNEDIAPTLTLKKEVTNNNCGTKGASDWVLYADGSTRPFYNWGPIVGPNQVMAGVEYTLTETLSTDYEPSGWICTGGGVQVGNKITLGLGENVTCTITNDDIQPLLKITKIVVGSTKSASDFMLFVGSTKVTSGEQNGFDAGTYTISETPDSDYNSVISGACASDGSITLAAGDVKECTITNTRKTGNIIFEKHFTPIGSGNTDDWTFTVLNGTTEIGTYSHLESVSFDTGNYTVVEHGSGPYYLDSIGGTACSGTALSGIANLTVTENGGTCVFGNSEKGTITIVKDSIPNDGQDFSFITDGSELSPFSLDDDDDSTLSNTKTFPLLFNGSYTITEMSTPGWDFTKVECTSDQSLRTLSFEDSVSLDLHPGENITCTFTNTKKGEIIVEKQVLPNGHPQTFPFTGELTGTIGDGQQISKQVVPGIYTVSENPFSTSGYRLTDITCDDGSSTTPSSGDITTGVTTFNVEAGETVKCTYTNKIFGSVSGQKYEDINGNGNKDTGDLGLPGWTIQLYNETGNGLLRTTTTDINGNYSFTDQLPGNYQVCEINQSGWFNTNPGGGIYSSACKQVTVTGGQDSINDFGNFHQVTINVTKNVLDPDGADILDTHEFTVKLNDSDPKAIAEGTTATYTISQPGTYSVLEIADPNYDYVGCYISQDTLATNFSIESGHTYNILCINKEKEATLILEKTVTNDNGGILTSSSFTVKIDRNSAIWGNNTVKPGTYLVSEDSTAGYTPSVWGGDCSSDGTVSLTAGSTKTCTITNDDIAPTLKLVKVVDHGQGQPGNWTLTATGTNGFSDSGNSTTLHTVDANTTYTLSESTSGVLTEGYSQFGGWSCDGGLLDGTSLRLELDQDVTCTVTNHRDTGSVKVNKKIDADGNGTFERGNTYANSNGFSWILDGMGWSFGTKVNNLDTTISNYYHTFGENMPSGYHFVSWFNTNEAGKTCANPNGTTLPTQILVEKDKTTEITLCNARDTGTITIIKDAINNSWEDFYFDTNLPSGDFSLADDGYNSIGLPKQKSFTVPTDVYSINERDESGWKLTDLQCIGNNNFKINSETGRVNIEIGYNENVTCTYTNTELAKVWGFKYNDKNGNGNWNWLEFGLGNWRIFIDEGNGVYDGTEPSDLTSNHLLSLGYYEFNNLLPGDYSICEQLQDGWTNTTPLCRTVTLRPGEVDRFVDFGNIRFGSILVHKFEDTNGNGNIDDNEGGLENWQIGVYDGYDCQGQVIRYGFKNTDNRGDAQFDDILPGLYSVMETSQDGWTTTSPICQNISVNSGSTTSVNIGNAPLTDIHGYKWSDLNGNGYRDCIDQEEEVEEADSFELSTMVQDICELEPLLPGWTINLFKWDDDQYPSDPFRTMVTDNSEAHLGWYWFEDLMPGKYKICEVPQDGWTQTSPLNDIGNCHEIELPLQMITRSLISANYLVGPEYNFGNTIDPKLEISKSNNSDVLGMYAGDAVIYTLTITTPEITEDMGIYTLKDVEVRDIMPFGFKYQTGSWTATSSIRGNLVTLGVTTEPTYGSNSSGTWFLEDMIEGEVITLTYSTTISLLQDPGIYKDIAWVKGTSVLDAQVLGNEDTGIFVGTQVKVIEPIEIEEGEVLGASTTITLPRTGADIYITIAALLSMILGALLFILNPMKKIKTLIIAGIILFGISAIVKPTPALASADSIMIQIEEPQSPTKDDNFNIGFVVLDLEDRTLETQCFESTYGAFGPVLNGNSGDCVIDSSVITNSGIYEFYITTTAGTDIKESNKVQIVVDLERPLPIINYEKTEGTCTYTLKFKTANDGRTSKIQIFRSATSPFTANGTTLIEELTVLPNQQVEYIDSSITDCNETYYYALRAADYLGNLSTMVTDDIVTIEYINTEPVDGQTEVTEESDTETDENGEVDGTDTEDGDIKGEEADDKTDEEDVLAKASSIWAKYKYVIIVIGILLISTVGYMYVKRRR